MNQEIESLRQQLAEKDAEIEQWKANSRENKLIAEECVRREQELRQQLSASQAREQQLREALQEPLGFTGSKDIDRKIRAALALPSDTTALSAMIAKAGEVMRERCEVAWKDYVWGENIDDAINAIPCVTLGGFEMNILTKEEIEFWVGSNQTKKAMARAIEAAVLKKLAEHVDMEPVADVVWFDPALELFTERKPHKIIDGSLAFMDTAELGTKLYTETQLIAAQQKAAEACAKVCANETYEQLVDSDAWYAAKNCRDQILDGDWRKYL